VGISDVVVIDGVACLRLFIRVNICLLVHDQRLGMCHGSGSRWPFSTKVLVQTQIIPSAIYGGHCHCLWCMSLSVPADCVSLKICYINAVCVSRSCTDEY
jgi:hypothetical protein